MKVVIYGKIIDENYVKILLKRFNEIDLFEAIGLDRVQKKQKIDKNLVEKLKAKKLIEGRYPNIFVAGDIVISEADKAKYIKNKAFDDQYLKDLIMKMFVSIIRNVLLLIKVKYFMISVVNDDFIKKWC